MYYWIAKKKYNHYKNIARVQSRRMERKMLATFFSMFLCIKIQHRQILHHISFSCTGISFTWNFIYYNENCSKAASCPGSWLSRYVFRLCLYFYERIKNVVANYNFSQSSVIWWKENHSSVKSKFVFLHWLFHFHVRPD